MQEEQAVTNRFNAKLHTIFDPATSVIHANIRLASYKVIDKQAGRKCDLTLDWLEVALSNPCFYCGDVSLPRGLDRIDNGLGHTKENTVPCCVTCNVVRANRFTPEEMKSIIGPAIALVRTTRPLVDVREGPRVKKERKPPVNTPEPYKVFFKRKRQRVKFSEVLFNARIRLLEASAHHAEQMAKIAAM